MAQGDMVCGMSSIADGAYLSIQPSAGQEWVIHNIYHEDRCEIEIYDGTNSLVFDADTGPGVWAWYEFHVKNTYYIRVKNVSGSGAKLIAYDGVQTK